MGNWILERMPTTAEETEQARNFLYGQLRDAWSTPALVAAYKARLDVLDAIAMRYTADRLTAAMSKAAADLNDSAAAMNASTAKMTDAIDAFTETSDHTARRMARWTMVLALATIGLTVATGGLVIGEYLKR